MMPRKDPKPRKPRPRKIRPPDMKGSRRTKKQRKELGERLRENPAAEIKRIHANYEKRFREFKDERNDPGV